MVEIEPESPELMAYYWQHIEEHKQIADVCHFPSFSIDLRQDLHALLRYDDAVRLVEVVTRMGNFGDSIELASRSKAVSRLLVARGVKRPRGKRTALGLAALVSRLTPLLLHFGLPFATSERSHLVKSLRMIASEIGVSGDPRDELRRLHRMSRSQCANARTVILTAIAQGLAPLDGTLTPHGS